MIYLHLLFWLLVGHALCDYPWQGDFLAQAKNHTHAIGMHCWKLALPSHAMIHAGAVTLITGSYSLGMLEFVAHGVIDFLKSDNRLTFTQDQLLHVLCKWMYVAFVGLGIVQVHPFFPV